MSSDLRVVRSVQCTLMITIAILVGCRPCMAQQRTNDAWTTLVNIAELVLGDDGVLAADDKIDALIDLHVEFSRKALSRPISSERIVLVKQGMRSFLKAASQRYEGDKRKAAIRLIRDIAANRAIFMELLSSDLPTDALEQQLFAYLERNQSIEYTEPVSIDAQVAATAVEADLQIVESDVKLIADIGTYGHANKAIDAGETIAINVPLHNRSQVAYRSTSAILRTKDQYIACDVSKVIYSDRINVGGDTVTFAPGMTIAPRQNFTFTILPECPDGHCIVFELFVGDSDRGTFALPFTITVYNVGPLDFGTAKIDDDAFGLSQGNNNRCIEPNETIEYVLAIQNKGDVTIESVVATLFSSVPRIEFRSGYERLEHKAIEPGKERVIPASFVFSLSGNDEDYPQFLCFRLLCGGMARGYHYSWVRAQVSEISLSDERWARIAALSEQWLASDNTDFFSVYLLQNGALDRETMNLQRRIGMRLHKENPELYAKVLLKDDRLFAAKSAAEAELVAAKERAENEKNLLKTTGLKITFECRGSLNKASSGLQGAVNVKANGEQLTLSAFEVYPNQLPKSYTIERIIRPGNVRLESVAVVASRSGGVGRGSVTQWSEHDRRDATLTVPVQLGRFTDVRVVIDFSDLKIAQLQVLTP